MRRFLVLALLAVPLLVRADPDPADTRLLQMPAVSKDHVAFVYAEDLWVSDLDGKNARRLTSHPGAESYPVFSPDGKTIAFSGQYEAAAPAPNLTGQNVYTIPVAGGEPKRLTWHPGWDVVRGWTPDGQGVLFSSWRESRHWADHQLFTVPATGGHPAKLPIPRGQEATYSPDGQFIAYNPNRDPTGQWKNYRGGTHGRIWVLRLSDLSVQEVPQPEGRCNDLGPRWMGDTLYFRSDRNGEANLFAYDPKTKDVRQLTKCDDFPVLNVGVGGGNVVFEQAGYLHRFDPSSGESKRLKIGVPAELPGIRPGTAQGKGLKHVRSISLSPNGSRVALDFRGEVVTLPAEKGAVRNLTNTPGVHERFPAWSPDGKSIVHLSDEGGEYRLHVRPADGKGPAKVHKLDGAGYYEDLSWSPDSKKLAYVDNSWALYWLDLESGATKKVAAEPVYGGFGRGVRAAWSPDSNWIAYALGNGAAYRSIHVYSLADDKSHRVTDGMSDATEPVFDASGKYLYFLASTDAGPVNHGFNLSARDMRATRRLYLAVLPNGTPSPFLPEVDEEKPKPAEKADAKKADPVRIDVDGLDRRIVAFPLSAGDYRTLRAGEAGHVYYLAYPPTAPGEPGPSAPLMRYDVAKRKAETISSGIGTYVIARDGKKAFVHAPPETLSVIDLAPGTDPGKTKLNMEAIEVRAEPTAEWKQIFDEAWRLNRDYFYAPNYHGADWPAMKKKYEPFLTHAASASDVYRIVRWMLSELSVSHSGVRSGDRLDEIKSTPGGLLGSDYEVADGRYRFKKVLGGVPWWPEARAPLAAPGAEVKEGEYLLAVRGKDLKPPASVYEAFTHTGGKTIEITVGPNADGAGSRTITVVPLANHGEEQTLRHLEWIEGNRKKVDKATGGRVAYIYLPDTTVRGHGYFKRYFYAQLNKDAVILDERGNGGGSWADYYLDHLRRPFSSYWALRYGNDFRSPSAAIFGPKVMLIDEQAGSGGDGLPWMFRQSKLGPLVGKRTWGGEVGTTGFPAMLDGGTVTAPNFALWSPDGGWVVENEGVPPDVDVEQWPADVQAGRDPQLDKAIEIILKELQKSPPPKADRPPYPVRVRKPS